VPPVTGWNDGGQSPGWLAQSRSFALSANWGGRLRYPRRVLELYTWDSPSGEKVHLAVEELGIDVEVKPVDLRRGEQRSPWFLELNPAGRVPVLVVRSDGEEEPLVLRDSASILVYLAEREGRLLPAEVAPRQEVIDWLMFQQAHVGPVFGLFHELFIAPETAVPAVLRMLRGRIERAYAILERGLEGREYLAGALSIADLACYPWLREPERVGIDRESFPNVRDWLARMAARPGVRRGIAAIEALPGG